MGQPEVATLGGHVGVEAHSSSEAPVDAGTTSVYATDDPPSTETSGQPGEDEPETDASPKRRRSLRKWLAVGLVAAVGVAVFGLIGVYSRSSYFVGFNEGQVVVYQGRPGGVLWFDPTIEANSPLIEGDLSDALVLEIEKNPDFGSVDDALSYIDEVETRAQEAEEASSSGS